MNSGVLGQVVFSLRRLQFAVVDLFAEFAKRAGTYSAAVNIYPCPDDIPTLHFVEANQCLSKAAVGQYIGSKWDALRGIRVASSSGTSGSPLVFPQSLSALQREQRFIDSLWRTQGFTPGSRMAVCRGTKVPGGVIRAGSRLLLSGMEWTDEDVRQRWNALVRFKPDYIHCYPSVLERFALRAYAQGLPRCDSLSAILAGSEETTAAHIGLFSEMFGCPTISWYGQSEQVALAVREEDGSFSVVPGYSEVAFIPSDYGYEIAGKSRCNEFFGERTYRTGDFCASVGIGPSRVLGCDTIRIFGLVGRSPVTVQMSDGESIPFNQIIFGFHSSDWLSIDRYCFFQVAPGIVCFKFSAVSGRELEANEFALLLAKRLKSIVEVRIDCDARLSSRHVRKWQYFFSSEMDFERAVEK